MPADLVVEISGAPVPLYLGENTVEAARQAGLASVERAAAEAARDTAEAARDVALANSTDYDTLALAEAGSVDGDFFTYKDASGHPIYAKNVGGVVSEIDAPWFSASIVGTPDGPLQDVLNRINITSIDVTKRATVVGLRQAMTEALAEIGGSLGDVRFGEITLGPNPAGAWWELDGAPDYDGVAVGILSEHQGIHFRGYGRPAIKWTGAADGYMVRTRDYSGVLIEGFTWLGDDSARPKAVWFSDDFGSNNLTSGTNELGGFIRNRVGRLWYQQGPSGHGVKSAIIFGGPAGVNNDEFRVDDNSFFDCSESAADLQNAQSVWGRFFYNGFSDCLVGIKPGSSTEMVGNKFNRCGTDIAPFRNTIHAITGFHSENSALLLDVTQGARVHCTGGKWLLSSTFLTGANYAKVTNSPQFTFEKMWVDPAATTGKTLLLASAASRFDVQIKACDLPNGSTRAGYDVQAPASTAGVDWDVRNTRFRFVGRLDGSKAHDFGNLAAGATELVSQAQLGVTLGAPYLVSHPIGSAGAILSGNAYGTNLLYARRSNIDGPDANLSLAKLRWRRIADKEIKVRKAGVTGFPASLAIKDSAELTATIPCAADAFAYWGCDGDCRTGQHSSYTSAADTQKLNLFNGNTSAINLSARSYTLYVVNDEAFDFINEFIVDLPEVPDAGTAELVLTVPGVEPGDMVLVQANMNERGHYIEIATGEVRVTFTNGTGSAIPEDAAVKVRVGVFEMLG